MNRFHSSLKFTLLCAMLIGLLAACNGSGGSRNTNSSINSKRPVTTSTAQSSTIETSAAPTLPPADKPAQAQPSVQVAPKGSAVSTDAQSNAQADEIDRALDDLTNQLNSLDTLDDLK